MRVHEAQRFRAIALLMESYAKEGKPQQALTISREVAACGESIETAHLRARLDFPDRRSVTLERKAT